MRLYVECFYTGVMPGPSALMRDRLIPCPPRSILRDFHEGLVSSSVDMRVNERAGLRRDQKLIFDAQATTKVLANGRRIIVAH